MTMTGIMTINYPKETDMDDDELMKKIETQVTKKSPASVRKKRKKKVSGPELYTQLRDEELKRLGYLK